MNDKETDKTIDRVVNVAINTGLAISGITIFAIGFDLGFQKGKEGIPTVVHGNQTINNNNTFWSPNSDPTQGKP